jgi:DNA-binding CsgD family transcriptional regulator
MPSAREGGAVSHVVGSDQPTRRRAVLLGRASERAAIDALLENARGGVADALLLSGPAGIGKSALVQYAADQGADFRVVRVVGVESEMAFGFAAVHQVALALAECMGELPPPQRAALDGVLANAPHDALDPFLVGLSVLSLVAEAARTQPVLAVIDDAQWLDDESAMAFSFVGHRLGAERLATLVTMRDAPLALRHFQSIRRIDLDGLAPRESRELLMAAASGPVDSSVADEIVEATDGNPLALTELPGVLTVEQLRGARPLPDPLPIGARLSGVFAERIRALDDGARTVLLLASAERLGDPRLLRRAADAVGGLSWDAAVASAEASGLVVFRPAVEFRHPLVRSAVYYSASASERRRAHAALAAALDADADGDRRAWHQAAAASGPDEAVAAALEATAEHARQRGGASAAAYFLWRSAELTPDPGRASERFLEAARAELVGGRGSRAKEIIERARSIGLAERHHAEAAWTESLIHLVDGDVRAAGALMAEALPSIRADEPELGVGACVAAQAAALTGGHLVDEGTRHAIAAGTRGAVDRCALPDPIDAMLTGLAGLLMGDRVGAIETLRPPVKAAVADQEHLRAVAGRRVHVVYLDTILCAAEVMDERAWAALAEGWSELTRRMGALSSLPLALSLRAWIEVLQGRLGSAASHVTEIEDVMSLTGTRGLLGAPTPAQVLRDAWLGNEEAARTGAKRMMQDGHERGHGAAIDHAYAALTVLELGAGRYDAALRTARHLFDHDAAVLGTLSLADVVEAAVRCGETGLAGDALTRLSERAAAAGTPWARGLLARAEAIAAADDHAEEHFRQAIDDLSRTTIATDTARAQLLYGEWLRRARRRKEAREPLHDALECFDRIGASGFAGRARGELAATGEHVRTRSAPIDVLTPQEAQIARLAASGARNHEIAAQLYISTSTVEYHLRKVFVKLGVTSRTQLAGVDLPT